MSGGRFDYDQFRIRGIADAIESEIQRSGRPITEEELKDTPWMQPGNHYKWPDEVLTEFRNAVRYLRIAEVYAQRVDWLLSGDDGNETFLERLKEDLEKLKQ